MTARTEKRYNHPLAQEVDTYAQLGARIGTSAAAEQMASKGVAVEVALRVLTRPALRRRSVRPNT
jgi:hypothetical protein